MITIYDVEVKDINLETINMDLYRGKILLIVNVASACGFTPQYKGLQEIYDKYKDKGFVVIGFPANNFRKQEPGTNLEIKQFCSEKYNVNFPIFSKISVQGEDKAPLYKELTSKKDNGDFGGEIPWNFTKFLVGKVGKVINRFGPRVKPDAKEVIKAIEDELKKENA